MNAEHLIPILASTVGAATPLVYAALGELIVERSGVLNLGVEGMMLVGAIAAFAVGTQTGSLTLGFAAGMAAGMLLSLLFGLLTLTLQTNQVATGLALTLVRRGPERLRRTRISSARSSNGLKGYRHPRAERSAAGRAAAVSLRRAGLCVDRAVHRDAVVLEPHARRAADPCRRRVAARPRTRSAIR